MPSPRCACGGLERARLLEDIEAAVHLVNLEHMPESLRDALDALEAFEARKAREREAPDVWPGDPGFPEAGI